MNKILRSLFKFWGPKVTSIQEEKDLKTLQLDNLLSSLITYETTLGEDSSKKKKTIALKATMKRRRA